MVTLHVLNTTLHHTIQRNKQSEYQTFLNITPLYKGLGWLHVKLNVKLGESLLLLIHGALSNGNK